MKGVLLQYNSVVHGENLCDHLKKRHTKRDRPECPAQKEEWQASSKGERDERLALFQECSKQRSPGNEDRHGEQGKDKHFAPMNRPDANKENKHYENKYYRS